MKGFNNTLQEFKAWRDFQDNNISWHRGNNIETFTYILILMSLMFATLMPTPVVQY